MSSMVESTPPPASLPLPTTGLPSTNLTRKCTGKNKSTECLQQQEHANTRWECAFASTSKEELQKHCKNIGKRSKWRDLIDATKPDKDGLYHCVYFSTDRHHVENHYQKGSADSFTPSPQQVMRYKTYLQGQRTGSGFISPSIKGKQKGFGKREVDDMDDDVDDAREMKKMKQDANLLAIFQEQQMDENGEKEAIHLPDNMKCTELIDSIQKKLQLSPEMCKEALDILHKQGFIIVAGLKTLKKESWDRLNIPMAIAEEIKSQISQSRVQYSYPHVGVPYPYVTYPHQGGFYQYTNSVGQVFYSYHVDPSQEHVQGASMHENVETDKEKEKNEEKEHETMEVQLEPSMPVENNTTLAHQLVETELKRENSEVEQK